MKNLILNFSQIKQIEIKEKNMKLPIMKFIEKLANEVGFMIFRRKELDNRVFYIPCSENNTLNQINKLPDFLNKYTSSFLIRQIEE